MNKNKLTPVRDLLTATHKPKPAFCPNRKKTVDTSAKGKKTITVDGKKYQAVNKSQITYNILACKVKDNSDTTLVDRGANRGIAGDNVLVIETTDRTADVTRLKDHQVKDLKIGTCNGVIKTNQGEVVALMH